MIPQLVWIPLRFQARHARVQHRLTETEINQLVERYQAGASIPDLVAEFTSSRDTAMKHLERRGVPRRACKPMLIGTDLQRAHQFYESGQSLAQVGTHFGVHGETVRSGVQEGWGGGEAEALGSQRLGADEKGAKTHPRLDLQDRIRRAASRDSQVLPDVLRRGLPQVACGDYHRRIVLGHSLEQIRMIPSQMCTASR